MRSWYKRAVFVICPILFCFRVFNWFNFYQDLDFQIKIGQDTSNDATAQNQKDETQVQSPSKLDPQSQTSTNTNDNLHILSLKRSAHPTAVAFHLLFKITGIISFMLFNFLMSLVGKENPIVTFLIVILSSAFDFWVVKNVTGRLLVGLRWGSEILEDGSEIWKYESHDEKITLNAFDKTMFWWAQYIMCLFWIAMFLFELITLKFFWGINAIISLILTLSNTIGFHKCSKEHQKKLKEGFTQIAFAGFKKKMEVL